VNIRNRLIMKLVLLLALLGVSGFASAACGPNAKGVGTFGNYTDQFCQTAYPCHVGNWCDGYKEIACTPGTYANTTSATKCRLAAGGYYVSDPTQAPVLASPGNYACGPGGECSGASAQTPCASGTYAATPGYKACLACPAGSSSSAGMLYCVNNPGYYCSYTFIGSTMDTGTCTPVSAGYYSTRLSNSQAPCPANTSYVVSSGSSGCMSNPGYFATFDSTATANTYRSCNVNGCNLPPVHINVTQAAAGYYAPARSQAQFACPAHSSSQAGASTCTSNAGYFCTVGSPSGVITQVPGQPPVAVINPAPVTCSQAAAGNYAAAGATAQTACPAGKTSPAGSSNVTACN